MKVIELPTVRDIEVTNALLVQVESSKLKAAIRAACSAPWVVTHNGKRLMAYGPWKVVLAAHHSLRRTTIIRVQRTLVRPTTAKNLPEGKVIDVAQENGMAFHEAMQRQMNEQ